MYEMVEVYSVSMGLHFESGVSIV